MEYRLNVVTVGYNPYENYANNREYLLDIDP